LLHARLRATLDRKRLRDSERLKNAELERLTAELKRSNEDLQRFAYAASHDLQAPVRTITTYIQLLQRRMRERINDDELEMFQFAEGAAKRMHTLIRDLLQYSQASTHQNRYEPISVNELLDDLVSDMRSVVREAGAQVTRDELPEVVYDSTRLRQLFQNLIGNAIKYRRAGDVPRVHVSGAREDGHWRFSVQDNGQGIPAEHYLQIFEMFQRLHGDEIPGSGIGLAVCKRIVERSGGKIWVSSEIGQGSTFSFTVPVPAEPAS
jgi:light-regulated signal transduction histidine kinase (bacteriophytochrome)